MSLPKWLAILIQYGPMILAATPLAPIAPFVVAGISEAEALAGASGPEKKAHVVAIAKEAAGGLVAGTGKPILDPAVVETTAGAVIDAVVGVVNTVHQVQAAGEPARAGS